MGIEESLLSVVSPSVISSSGSLQWVVPNYFFTQVVLIKHKGHKTKSQEHDKEIRGGGGRLTGVRKIRKGQYESNQNALYACI